MAPILVSGFGIFLALSRTLSSDTPRDERLAFKYRLDDLNNSLSKISANYPLHVRFDNSLAKYKFTKEDVSSQDCFHPSLRGQNLISQLTWDKGWF